MYSTGRETQSTLALQLSDAACTARAVSLGAEAANHTVAGIYEGHPAPV